MSIWRRKDVGELQAEAASDHGLKRALGPINLTALGIGAIAVVVAVVATPLLPQPAVRAGGALGPGPGIDASLQLGDDLRRPEAVEVLRGGGGEVREGILALYAAVGEIAGTMPSEDDRPVVLRADEEPADVGVLAQRGQELRMALLDLLEREPPLFFHQIDEAEVP